MSRIKNNRKQNYLMGLAISSLESSGIEEKCKFNFSYFDTSEPANDFKDWDFENLCDFLHRLKEFSKNSLKYWIRPWEMHNSPLEIYGDFPSKAKTKFTYPCHVPANVKWARFRLSGEVRLIGFIIPDEFCCQSFNESHKFILDSNTFYVVFLDLHHQFWISSKKNT